MNHSIRISRGDRAFQAAIYVIITLLFVVILYPLVYVLSSSFSSGKAISMGKVVLLPVDFSLDGYATVFSYRSVLTGYRNTILYTLAGAFINVVMTVFCAYPLARKDLQGRKTIMLLFTATMFFSGGLIPGYIQVKNLRMINTVWSLLLPGAISVYNMIITRTYIETTIPKELLDAAMVDGCSDLRYLFQIVLPLSKAILAVISLYYGVAHWNAWFNAFLYINDRGLYPLQLVVREILVANVIDPSMVTDPILAERLKGLADIMKNALIVISSVPMMLVYPLVQKFFIRGVMIGSIKG